MKIFNSLTQKLEEFQPINDKKVTIYVCGITPYDTTHLGHAFTYIFFDALIRYLKFKGFKVTYTQNVTDINDRDTDILQRAKEQGISWSELAELWTKRFLKDMTVLNWTKPTHYLKASEQIPSIIRNIEKLLQKRLAYQIAGSVYLDIAKFSDYGKLSRFSKKTMFKVSKDFEEDLECPEKRNPLDITLWRASSPDQPKHIPSFSSPFGLGRPGWHIECSAMALSTLSEQTISGERSRTIDIHGGGKDLIFPHHEAEIAQSEGVTGRIPFAKYFLHTGNVFFKGEKMSKSKGNLVLISNLIKKYSANAIRWLLLSHHWRESWEYKEEDLKKAQTNVEAVEQALASQGQALERKTVQQFSQILDQNFDTPKALQFLLKLAKQKAKGVKNLFNLCLGFKINLS